MATIRSHVNFINQLHKMLGVSCKGLASHNTPDRFMLRKHKICTQSANADASVLWVLLFTDYVVSSFKTHLLVSTISFDLSWKHPVKKKNKNKNKKTQVTGNSNDV